MKHLLMTLIIVAVACMAGCDASKDSNSGKVTIESEIMAAAEILGIETADGYMKPLSVKMTSAYPKAYLVTFETNIPGMVTVDVADGDDAAYRHNAEITKTWAQWFCTETMKSLAKKHNLSMISGTVVNASGKRYSSTACF